MSPKSFGSGGCQDRQSPSLRRYQSAISAVLNVLEQYDHDQQFPVYGEVALFPTQIRIQLHPNMSPQHTQVLVAEFQPAVATDKSAIVFRSYLKRMRTKCRVSSKHTGSQSRGWGFQALLFSVKSLERVQDLRETQLVCQNTPSYLF